MCIAIITTAAGEAIELTFAHERIFQQRDGSYSISMDLLIYNKGSTPIHRLRLIVPSSLVDVSRLRRVRDDSRAKAIIRKLKSRQKSQIQVVTPQFNDREHRSHWVYNTTLSHVEIDRTTGEGQFRLKLHDPLTGLAIRPVEGFIKHGWEIKFPHEDGLTDWAWTLLAYSKLAVFDLVRSGRELESLQVEESMWVRLEVIIPALDYNKKSWWARGFYSVLDYHFEFKSPGLVAVDGRLALEQFHVDSAHGHVIGPLLINSKREALAMLPPEDASTEVKDWRTFLYFDRRLEVDPLNIGKPRNATSLVCNRGEYEIPSEADRGLRERRLWPKWMRVPRVFRGSRHVTATELFFGTEPPWSNTHPDCYSVGTRSRVRNRLYTALGWAAFIVSIVSFILSVIALRG